MTTNVSYIWSVWGRVSGSSPCGHLLQSCTDGLANTPPPRWFHLGVPQWDPRVTEYSQCLSEYQRSLGPGAPIQPDLCQSPEYQATIDTGMGVIGFTFMCSLVISILTFIDEMDSYPEKNQDEKEE
jgi:hypothetical protein